VPRAIRIPAIGVASSDVAPVGRNSDGTLAVPPLNKVGQLGWYKASPIPGDAGPSVVVAHIAQKGKAGLFARLDQLQPGDTVAIDRADGLTAVFRVTRNEQAPKTAFPTESVYGDTPDPELRLISCGGRFSEAHRGYLDQVLVYATLISLAPTVS